MTEPKKLPIFMGTGDEQIQIGEMAVFEYKPASQYENFLAKFDVFPGERLTFSRIARLDDIIRVSEVLYPKGDADGKH